MAAAFERGRQAERERLAQDLHDDLGARLLTLILRTREPDLADSLRDTLRDLKALTRGLSCTCTSLSDAAAEWQADARNRLGESGIDLAWTLDCGANARLDTEHWFGLTRVLRELISNAIAHAHPSRVSVDGGLRQGWLQMGIADDGDGRAPHRWQAGLGVSGVVRRVRELGGTVHWEERPTRGIRCTLRVPMQELNRGPAQAPAGPRPGPG